MEKLKIYNLEDAKNKFHLICEDMKKIEKKYKCSRRTRPKQNLFRIIRKTCPFGSILAKANTPSGKYKVKTDGCKYLDLIIGFYILKCYISMEKQKYSTKEVK